MVNHWADALDKDPAPRILRRDCHPRRERGQVHNLYMAQPGAEAERAVDEPQREAGGDEEPCRGGVPARANRPAANRKNEPRNEERMNLGRMNLGAQCRVVYRAYKNVLYRAFV